MPRVKTLVEHEENTDQLPEKLHPEDSLIATGLRELYLQSMWNISTVDGREIPFTYELRPHLSEAALHQHRAVIEIETVIAWSESGYEHRPVITEAEKAKLRALVAPENFDPSIPIEYDHFGRNGVGPLEHDVTAVVMTIKELLPSIGLERLAEWIHVPMTSEDVNNLAYNNSVREAINTVWLPDLLAMADVLADYAVKYADIPVLSLTHGMNASPTTFGKRFSYTLERLTEVIDKLRKLQLTGKFSGATGNDNAMTVVAPDFDYAQFGREFVENMGFKYSENENQRNSHHAIIDLLNEIQLINIFCADLCENVRHNVMMGWFAQEGKKSNVGSSVMPHKINPWFFEVGQGYFEGSSNSIDGARAGLLMSVMERDLTDHPWERTYGEIIGKSLVGIKYVLQGMDTLRINDEVALEQLQATPEILTEAVQIAGRISGVPNVYMSIKNLARGRKIDRATLDQIIQENIPAGELQEKLLALKPEEYVGRAPQIARQTARRFAELKPKVERGILDPSYTIDAVLFDLDTTLQFGDKLELIARLNAISQHLGFGFSEEKIAEFGNRSDYKEMRKLMVEAYNAKYAGPPITEDEFEAVNKQYSGQFDDHFYLGEGVVEMLQTLKTAGKKIGLVTTRGANSLYRLLDMHGIHQYFDVIIDRTATKEQKPHPKPIALALEKLGITDPSRTVYVGDKQLDDVGAGNALGMVTVLVNDDELDQYGAIPAHHLSSAKEIIGLFGRG